MEMVCSYIVNRDYIAVLGNKAVYIPSWRINAAPFSMHTGGSMSNPRGKLGHVLSRNGWRCLSHERPSR